MDRKKAIVKLYDKYALDFEERTRDYIADGRELFIKSLSTKALFPDNNSASEID